MTATGWRGWRRWIEASGSGLALQRLAWLETLSQVCARFNWRCHAWCQMTNHYHVVVETAEGNLSLGMRQLNGVYTQWINRTHKQDIRNRTSGSGLALQHS
jgi:REP element-mobilizing transposase RayT